jgi:hypothetical protein
MYNTLILFLSLILITACSDESSKEYSNELETITFVPPVELLETPSEFFQINTTKDTIVIGKKGTKITFTKGCFNTDNEQVRVELKEFYDLPTMIKEGLRTKSDNRILETDGMVYINATTLQGDLVLLKEDSLITLEMPLSDTKMSLFYGEVEKGYVNWDIEEERVMNEMGISIMDTTFTMDERYNNFEITQLGWINADKFINCKNKTDLFVSLPENQEGAVYCLAFYNYNSILPGIPNYKGQLVFKGVPSNEKVTLMGIGSKDGVLYYSSLNLTTDTKNTKLSTLKEISKDELQAELENKFGNDLAQRPQPKF